MPVCSPLVLVSVSVSISASTTRLWLAATPSLPGAGTVYITWDRLHYMVLHSNIPGLIVFHLNMKRQTNMSYTVQDLF